MTMPKDHMDIDLPFGPGETSALPSLAPRDHSPVTSGMLGVLLLAVIASYVGLSGFSPAQGPCVIYFVGAALITVSLTELRYIWMVALTGIAIFYLPIGLFPLHVVLSVIMLKALGTYLFKFYFAYASVEARPDDVLEVGKVLDSRAVPASSWQTLACGVVAALRSWLTYPDPKLPGHWKSPCGNRSVRQFVTIMLALLTSRALLQPMLFVFVWFTPMDDNTGHIMFEHGFLMAWGLSLLLSPIAVAVAITMLAGRKLGYIYVRLQKPGGTPQSRYDQDISRLTAKNPQHFMMRFGRNKATNVTIAKDASVLMEHALIDGPTRAGKSTSLIELIDQCARYHKLNPDTFDQPHESCSIVVLDFKGDSLELFSTLLKHDLPVKRFSLRDERASHMCNPMQMDQWKAIRGDKRAEVVMSGLGTSFKNDHGVLYYETMQLVIPREAFRQRPNVQSLNELQDHIRRMLAKKDQKLSQGVRRDGELAVQLLEGLRMIDPLHATAQNQPKGVYENRIDFGNFFRETCYAYLDLSSLLSPRQAPMVGHYLFNTLLQVGVALQPRRRKRRVIFITDEGQVFASAGFQRLVALARSIGVSLVLATQTLDVLRGRNWDLRAVLTENVGLRRTFAFRTPEQLREIQQSCGEYLDVEESLTVGPQGSSRTYRPVLRPRFSQSELLRLSANPHMSVLRFGKHFQGAPILVENEYTMTKDEYEAMRCADWPEADDTTVQPIDSMKVTLDAPTRKQEPRPRKPKQPFESKMGGLDPKAKAKPEPKLSKGAKPKKRKRRN